MSPRLKKAEVPTSPSEENGQASVPSGSSRSVSRILGLIEVLARDPDGYSLAQLSSELGSPKSSLLMLLRSLVADGYMLRSDSRYLLGPKMFSMAARVLEIRRLPQLLRPFLEELAERSQETVYLAVLDEQAKVLTFIDSVASTKLIRFVAPIGYDRPLYATAAGRLLLANQSAEWQEDYLRTVPRTALTSHTRTDAAELREELIAIRELGLSLSIDEAVDGGGAVAAPVTGQDGEIEAALVIAAPTPRLRRQLPVLQNMVRGVAVRASEAVAASKRN